MAESVKIIENGFLVSCDRQRTTGYFALLLKDDRIAEISTRSDGFKARFPAAEIVDASEKIVLPGFIDAHYHGESFVLRNWTSGVPMARWQKDPGIRAVFKHVYHDGSKDDLILMYRSAYFSALKSGITFLSEFCFDNLDTPFAAAREAMKRSDVKGFVCAHNGEQIEYAKAQTSTSIRSALVLPGEDDLTTYNLQTTLRAATDLHWPIVSHLGETRRGLETLKRNFHRSIPGVLDEYRLFSLPLHLVHCACLEDADHMLLTRARSPLILNASSILAKGSEVPPLALILDAGMTIALCSDWGVPDPFVNMRALQSVARLSGMEALDPFMVLSAHTLHAAQALGVQDETGSIEAGKKADLTFLDVSDLRLQLPFHRGSQGPMLTNLLSQATAHMVSDVMINGEFFLRARQVMTYAEEDLRREYKDVVERLLARTGTTHHEAQALPEEPAAGAAIFPLTRERPLDVNPKPRSEDWVNEPSEEGFRIVSGVPSHQDSPESERKQEQEQEQEQEQSNRELPKTVRRVFGEDDN